MSKHTNKGGATPKGSRSKKESAFERHQARSAVPHHDFVGEVKKEQEQAVVSEMAQELEHEAGVDASAPRVPHSLGEAREMFRELRENPERLRELRDRAPELLREKARERLEALPAPVKRVVSRAESAATTVLGPLRAGAHLVGEVLRLPLRLANAVLHRRQEV